MSGQPIAPPPGWYPAKGDPPGTQRYWNGTTWEGGPRPVPGVAVGDVLPLAELYRRMTARAIDVGVWLAIALVIRLVLSVPFDGADALAILLSGLAIGAYEAYFVGTSGATLGKRAIGLAVVDENGSEATVVAGVRRAAILFGVTLLALVPFLWILSWIVVPLLALAGILMIYADDRQQTPWDKIGRTLVVMR